MKRLIFFVNSMQPAGGIERVIATLIDKLSGYYDITLLVKDQPISFYKLPSSVKIETINNALEFDMHNRLSRVVAAFKTIFTTSQLLKSYLKDKQFDLIYTVHPLNVLELRLAGIDYNKLIISEHASRMHYNSIYRMMKKRLYKKCKAYVVPTTSDCVSYQTIDKYPAINIPHFKSALPYKKAAMNTKTVLNIGRFTDDKQQLLLLNIWKKIISDPNYNDWCLHLAGSGELINEITNFIADNKLADNVKVFPPSSNVENYYLNSSIFVLTSRSEGFGMVLLEAISFGLPCVTFNCPSGPRDIIKDGYNGYLIELNDSESFELHLLKLMADDKLAEEMSTNAITSSENWNDGAILSKWQTILN